jgi:acetylornithine deacetylase/succinyl-diaminopimelate desuccinylase-like protein
VGPDARVAIPAAATASLGIRMVQGNTAEYLMQRIVDHIEDQGYYVVSDDPTQEERKKYSFIAKVTPRHSVPPSRTSMNEPMARRVIDALTGYYETDPVLIPSMGAGIGIFYLFHDILGMPVIFTPMVNYDNNQHGPNENLRIGHLWTGIETYGALMVLSDGGR